LSGSLEEPVDERLGGSLSWSSRGGEEKKGS